MPIAEIVVLLRVGGSIGWLYTVLIVLVTAILGAVLVKSQGLRTLNSVREQISDGELPTQAIGEGVALLFAGAVLLTPGFITDAIGFSLLTPPIRKSLVKWVLTRIQMSSSTFVNRSVFDSEQGSHPAASKGSIYEGEYKSDD